MKDKVRSQVIKKISVTLLTYLFFLSGGLNAQSVYREESQTLESMYEMRAKSALDSLIKPDHYSLLVSVDINDDKNKIADIEKDLDEMSLPGMSGVNIPDSMKISNKLHGLRNQVHVHLLLDDTLGEPTETAARSLVKMRLHLDEEQGDTITIARAPIAPVLAKPNDPEMLPELSWRMWALVIVISFLSIGALLYLFQKRKEQLIHNKLETKNADADKPGQDALDKVDHQTARENKSLAQAPSFDKELIELYERKKALLSLAEKYPKAAANALDEEIGKGQQEKFIAMFEHLGWEESKTLFKDLTPRGWSQIGFYMLSETKKYTNLEILNSLEYSLKKIVAKFLELGEGDLNNPFYLITKLTSDDLSQIMNKQSAEDIAVLSAHLNPSEQKMVFESLNENRQQDVLIQLSKLHSIDYQKVTTISEKFKKDIIQLKQNPIKKLNGIDFLINTLGQLSPLTEYRFIEKLAIDSPADFEQLRNQYLIFDDIKLLPPEILSLSFSSVDMKILTKALFTASDEIRNHIFASLPEKRARMIEKDLAYLQNVSELESLTAQKVIRDQILTTLKIEEKSLNELLKLSDLSDSNLKVSSSKEVA